MKSKCVLIALLTWLIELHLHAAGAGSGFTYQGRLTDADSPANGSYDLRFALFDAITNGVQIGATTTNASTAVSNGLFSVKIDFGPAAFGGDARWLEIGVRPGASTNSFSVLTPRQEITPSPYSVTAVSLTNAVDASTEKLRIIRGTLVHSGTWGIAYGTGFNVDSGLNVSFSTAFSSVPSVVVSQPSSGCASTIGVSALSTSGFTVANQCNNGMINFIAIGPR